MQKFKILVAPTHYIIDQKNNGSEIGWAYNIYKGLVNTNKISFHFVTGFFRGEKDGRVIDLKIFDPNLLDVSVTKVFEFYLKCGYASMKKIMTSDIDLIHHILPFTIGKSFNISLLISGKPYILGPIQLPLTVLDDDLNTKNIRSFDSGKKSIADRTVLLIVGMMSYILKLLSLRTLQKANTVISVDQKTKNYLINYCGVKTENITIINPGVHISSYLGNERKYLPKTKLKLITVSLLIKRKAIDNILKAVKEASINGIDLELIVVGDGPQKEKLEILAKEMGISKQVTFVGFVENHNISSYLKNADIFISMSRSESWGQMYIEAMCNGLVVLSTRNGGSESIIKDGKTGILIPVDNISLCSKALANLFNGKYDINKMSKNTLQEVLKYDYNDSVIPQYYKIYKKYIDIYDK